MSRIDELIAELCPEGVEFFRVGDIASVGTGSSDRKDATDDGEFPFYVRSREVLRIDEYEFDEEAILIPGEGGIGEIFHYVSGKYALHQRAYRISFHHDQLDTKFAYYYFAVHFKTFILLKAVSATVTSIRKPMIKDFSIPIPPLEIQREIVKVLDTFTQLEAELEAELEARRRQYQYYRDALLNFGADGAGTKRRTKDIRWLKLTDLADSIKTGKLNANAMVEGGAYPFFTCDANPFWIDKYAFDTEAILVSGNGSQVGHINYYKGKFNAYQRTYVLSNFAEARVPYLLHYLRAFLRAYIVSNSKKGSVPYITLPMLQNFMVPVPAENEQDRIASILDQFDTLVNDLSSGLPAEIKARRQQYEYYRDRLLSFKEAA
jgi:type I restriction enzyme S subunit